VRRFGLGREELIVHVAWHGSPRMKVDVLRQLRALATDHTLGPVSIHGEAIEFFDTHAAVDFDLKRLASAIGWPPDLLALCFELFYDGLVTDPLGWGQHVEGALGFLKVARPGADLRSAVPAFVASRLTEEHWRAACTNAGADLLDTVALTILDGGGDSDLCSAVEEAIQQLAAQTKATGRAPGTEGVHYELRALRWCWAALAERKTAPARMGQFADAQHLDFAAPKPAVGVPFPSDYREGEREHESALRSLMLSLLASSEAGRCSWDCRRRAPPP
jgi:hypothetical protein